MEANGQSVLICEVGPVRFALALAEVAEILPVVPLWRPPTMPRPLVGFAVVRGAPVAVLATATLLGDGDVDAGDTAEDTGVALHAHLVRVRDGAGGTVCLLVDRAAAIMADAAVRPLEPDASRHGCAIGLVATAGGAAHLIAVPRLLSDGAAARVAALTAEAGRHAAMWAA